MIKELTALRKSTKQPIAYLGIMPEDMERIDEPGRKALMELTNALGAETELAAVAMEARGFSGAAIRSLLAGIMLVSGFRTKIKFVDNIATAMRLLEALPLPDRDAIRAVIEKVGGAWEPGARRA